MPAGVAALILLLSSGGSAVAGAKQGRMQARALGGEPVQEQKPMQAQEQTQTQGQKLVQAQQQTQTQEQEPMQAQQQTQTQEQEPMQAQMHEQTQAQEQEPVQAQMHEQTQAQEQKLVQAQQPAHPQVQQPAHPQVQEPTHVQVQGQTQVKAQADDYLIVALGDSITAGYEPGMDASGISYGFVERLKEQGLFHGRTRAVNYGILGLTSEGLKNYVAAVRAGGPVTADAIQLKLADPRMAALAAGTAEAKRQLEQADLITITIGGNDLLRLLPDVQHVSLDELRSGADEILNAYAENVRVVIGMLTELNPSAQIVLADQYQPVPELAGSAVYGELTAMAGKFTAIVDGIAAGFAADAKPVQAAHVAAAFQGRELSLTHIFAESDIHPNQAGYEEIAKVFAQAVWGIYRETAARSGAAPISIVVKGQELKTPYPPVLKNGQTFVAIKDITEAIGAESKWDSRTQTASVVYGSRTAVIPIGSGQITVNGTSASTASPAFLQTIGGEHKTYVPLTLLAQGLGLDVQYSAKMKTVFVNE
ncbi:stalk domain-containing protein [Paenibacillus macerans]|uniref:stalk domain-containing protein n=3 Tax=Paenibacillus macerans TaxID=44252 RepID=UPI003D26CCED